MANATTHGKRAVRRVRGAFRGRQHAARRGWVIGSAIGGGTLVACALGVHAWRLRRQSPSLQGDASATAISVHDAAKRVVIDTVRQAPRKGDGAASRLRAVSGASIREAAAIGADITAAALGSVEGALSVARELDLEPRLAGMVASEGAIEASRALSDVAARRVRAALGAHQNRLAGRSGQRGPLRRAAVGH